MIYIILAIIIFIITLYISYKLFVYMVVNSYRRRNPGRRFLKDKLLKNYLKNKYGSGYKPIYKEVKKTLWDKYKIK